jgi:hypothetical protein
LLAKSELGGQSLKRRNSCFFWTITVQPIENSQEIQSGRRSNLLQMGSCQPDVTAIPQPCPANSLRKGAFNSSPFPVEFLEIIRLLALSRF